METKDIIKELRKKHGYTTDQVATGAGIAPSVYPKYESGILNAGVPVICKLADFYGVSTDYLLGREKPIAPDILTRLAQEFNLTELDKVLVQAYIAISPSERTKFVDSIAKAVEQKEAKQQETPQRPNIQISQIPEKAIARSKDNPFIEVPTLEQIASFTPVPEDSDL